MIDSVPNGRNSHEPLFSPAVWLLFALGLAVRMYAYHVTYIINPDGMLYIQQARAIVYGTWNQVFTCGLHFLSSYPFLIVGAHTLSSNWVTAARLVSLLFGTLTLLPVYLTSRRFFDLRLSLMVLLIFALLPSHVDMSVDVMRDPTAWFFLTSGIYLFIRHIERPNHRFLFLAVIFFLIAAWTRIETSLTLIVSTIYLLFFQKEKKFTGLLTFGSPFLVLALVACLGLLSSNIPLDHLLRFEEIPTLFTGPIHNYALLQDKLSSLLERGRDPMLRFFLPEARNLLWLIALGVLINRALEAYFYPYFLVAFLGLGGIGKRCADDPRVRYLCLMIGGGLILLYLFVVKNWILMTRYFAIVIFPSLILFGVGLGRIDRFLSERFSWSCRKSLAVLMLLILLAALPKDLASREKDKFVYRRIAAVLSSQELEGAPVRLAGLASPALHWIRFYANLDYPNPTCPLADDLDPENAQAFFHQMQKEHIAYFLMEEKAWQADKLSMAGLPNPVKLTVLGSWSHPDSGSLILYQLGDARPNGPKTAP